MNTSNPIFLQIRKVLLALVGLLTLLPLAPLVNRLIPPIMVGDINLDLVVSIILSAAIIFAIVRLFDFLLIPAILLCVMVVGYNKFTNGYGFGRMLNDYSTLVKTNWDNKSDKNRNLELTPSIFDGPLTRTVKTIHSKVDYKDSVVRNFAVKYSLKHFDKFHNKYGATVRMLSLFKHINNNFKYVHDSQKDEYFAKPQETILNGLGGDCDDHSILMVSALKAIGAKTRMVLTEGHIYPELYCGDKAQFEKTQEAILELFGKEVSQNIYFHENNGQYWLNLDYSARYPGGPYVKEKAFAIIEG